MKKSLIALSVLAATNALAGGGLAVNDARVPVGVSGNGLGDLLIAPVYFANGGWSSELKLINTSTTFSTVAKVVINERATSAELLDFLVFLSPGDVWNGTITCDTSGAGSTVCTNIRVTSSDVDSVPQFTATNGVVTIRSGQTGGAGDVGYINVVESAAWNLGGAPVPKATIVAQHNRDLQVTGRPNAQFTTIAATNTTPFATTAQVGLNRLGFTGYEEVRTATIAASENILAGNLRISNSLNNAVATLPLTAVQNYRNAQPLTTAFYTGIGTDNRANLSPAYTTVGALEIALLNNDIALPYDHTLGGDTLASVTFPTRTTFDSLIHGANAGPTTPGIYQFNNVSRACVPGTTTIRDQQENIFTTAQQQTSPIGSSPVPLFAELSFIRLALGNTSVASDAFCTLNVVGTQSFNTGWVNLNLTPQLGAPTQYAGAPAIVTQLQITPNGNSARLEWWYPQAKVATGVGGND